MKSLQINGRERNKQDEENENEKEAARVMNRIRSILICVLNAFQIQAIMSNKSSIRMIL